MGAIEQEGVAACARRRTYGPSSSKKSAEPEETEDQAQPRHIEPRGADDDLREAGPARKGRYEPWQFDAENHYIYCGFHSATTTSDTATKAIDHDEHNSTYKRRLWHGDPSRRNNLHIMHFHITCAVAPFDADDDTPQQSAQHSGRHEQM